MIFKVHYNSALLNSGKPNTYVSFCERKLNLSRLEVHNFLYSFLYERKIINFPTNMFSFEVNAYGYKIVKCYISTERKKWYCKLEELTPALVKLDLNFTADMSILRQQIMAAVTDRARRDIQNQVDAEIFQELDDANRAHQDNRVQNPFDHYVYVNAIRDNDHLVWGDPVPDWEPIEINPVINPPANLDAALDELIQVDPIDE